MSNLGFGSTFSIGSGALSAPLITLLDLPNRLADTVQWNSLQALVTSGIANYSAQTTGVNLIISNKPERLHGNGTITVVSFHNKTKTNISSVVVLFWRKDGSTYDIIYQEDVYSKINGSDAIQTVTLTTPVNVLEGDYMGIRWVSGATIPIAAAISGSADSARTGTGALTNNYDWDSKTGLPSFTVMHAIGQATMLACLGDSIMECSPGTSSMLATTETTVVPSVGWQYKLHALDNRFKYLNFGIGGQDTTNIATRFTRDVVNKKPVFAVINGGVNDIYQGDLKADFITNWTNMLNSCVSNNIIPIVWKIMPWTNGTNGNLQTRDDWNASLVTLFNSYNQPGWIIIDWDADLGVNRVGGDSGNRWNVNPTYVAADGLGVHYNETGNAKIAEVMLREIGKVYKLS